MSDTDSNQKTFHSLSSLKKRNKADSIPFRIELIKELMDGNRLETIVDYDEKQTEYFAAPHKYFEIDEEESRDTNQVLNKKKYNFHKIIDQIGGKLTYKKSGTTGHAFKGVIKLEDGEEINYGVKVVAYPKRDKYGSMYNINRPENAELKMIRLLSYFVINQITPHIILPIATFYTPIKPFVTLIEDDVVDVYTEFEEDGKIIKKDKNQKYVEFVKKYKKGYYHKYVSILLCEWANKRDFLDFIRKDYENYKEKGHTKIKPIYWKVFLFQILSVLAHIQDKFPSFRHNDLKANNILVHETEKKKGSRFKYKIDGKLYYVPNIGYQLKLWDFDFACIPGIVDNEKVNTKWTTEINVTPEKNRYYDIHYFFNTLIRKGFFPQFLTSSHVPDEARDFVARIIPRKFRTGKRVHERGRILVNHEYTTPKKILEKDPYFEEFRDGTYKKRNRSKYH
ncbi:MAG: hypothetical protein CMF62_00910 [Magnetococcales bacterium]|nr:hypothetical protein [Magnetococcales bacterium]|tara:strand:- start:13972 stop:15324 length:1353 start_codon:yes stop_codon:yes gene_type:complete